jgi:acyl-CoA thioesterase
MKKKTTTSILFDVSSLRNGRYITKLVVDGNLVKQSIFAIAR